METETVLGAVLYFLTHPDTKTLCLVDDDEWKQIKDLLHINSLHIELALTFTPPPYESISIDRYLEWSIVRVQPNLESLNGFFSRSICFLIGSSIPPEIAETMRCLYGNMIDLFG